MKKRTPIYKIDQEHPNQLGKAKLAELIEQREKQGLSIDTDSLRAALQREIAGLPAEEISPSSEPELDFEYELSHDVIESDALEDSPYLQFEVFKSLPSPNGPELKTRDSESCKRMSETVVRLRRSGSMRKVMRPTSNWKVQVTELRQDFPNFAEVIDDAVEPYLALLAMSKTRPPRFAPILLEGGPGIGKTRFTQELKRVLNTNCLFLDMASQTNGSSLAGSSAFWANSSHGELLSCLAWDTPHAKATAAPLVVLDEIDKVDTASRYNPLAALYSLLEEDTASHFEDAALPGVLVDASRVLFCLTANDAALIPAPIISRVQHFFIEPPSASQQRVVLQRIYLEILSRIDVQFGKRLHDDVIEAALDLSPRVAKLRLQICVGKACAADKDTIDLATWSSTDRSRTVSKPKIGFY